jgi:hypothetical protein
MQEAASRQWTHINVLYILYLSSLRQYTGGGNGRKKTEKIDKFCVIYSRRKISWREQKMNNVNTFLVFVLIPVCFLIISIWQTCCLFLRIAENVLILSFIEFKQTCLLMEEILWKLRTKWSDQLLGQCSLFSNPCLQIVHDCSVGCYKCPW